MRFVHSIESFLLASFLVPKKSGNRGMGENSPLSFE